MNQGGRYGDILTLPYKFSLLSTSTSISVVLEHFFRRTKYFIISYFAENRKLAKINNDWGALSPVYLLEVQIVCCGRIQPGFSKPKYFIKINGSLHVLPTGMKKVQGTFLAWKMSQILPSSSEWNYTSWSQRRAGDKINY